MAIRDALSRCPYIPVLTVHDAASAVDLARALVEGGLPTIEITLRTPAALQVIENMAAGVPEATIGVGTVLDEADFARARDAGAKFAVSPGLDKDLVAAARAISMDYLPGIQTASEALAGVRMGLDALKFFPALVAGGPYALGHLAPLYPGLVFCPTGGINLKEAPDYLALANVACVGGSYPAPADLIAAKDWDGIRDRARLAAALL
jgi:2-dehydro-3-deoxyphosphogluconate aldolase/(4S)-4-hydroxy-2-oxoglutarate aldolase